MLPGKPGPATRVARPVRPATGSGGSAQRQRTNSGHNVRGDNPRTCTP